MWRKVLLKTFDHVILVDWRYPADPVVAFGFPIPAANFFVMHADVQVVGRVTANLIAKKLVIDKDSPCIDPDGIRVVGFSAGGNMLYFISTWLKERYDITLGHLVDPSGPPFYFSSNFVDKQLKPGLAKAVDMVQCTFNFEIPLITELQALTLRFGSFNATGNTKYLVNLPYSYIEQPGCLGTPSCSHFYCLVIYTASLFPGCGFRYSPCNYLGTTTYLDAKTNLNSRVEGSKGLICIQASENPLRDCTLSTLAGNT
uniref:Lipase domain-containing protein n=1 Tax=Tetranychus urticae TaxID=32264 RepID=T1L1N3_TETUR